MKLFDDMENQGLRRDNVVFINGVRAAGFCRPWSTTLRILEQAYKELGELFRPVADTAITNLKYQERGSEQSLSSVSRAWELLEWMMTKGIQPSSKTMVSASSPSFVVAVSGSTGGYCTGIVRTDEL
jgi:hypothetical protein